MRKCDLSERSMMQLPRKMSAHNVMASISRTLGNREHKAPVANEIRFAGDESKDKLYEPKHKQKLVRVLTVVAYVIFVSMAAILLSLYYTFLWDPKDPSIRVRINKPECPSVKSYAETSVLPSFLNETSLDRQLMNSTVMMKSERSVVTSTEDTARLKISSIDLINSTDMETTTTNVVQTTMIDSNHTDNFS